MFTMGESGNEQLMSDDERGVHTHLFYLDVISFEGKRQRIPLPQTELVVGRSPNRCDLVIEDTRISRVHLRIAREPDKGITLTDLYSANGTDFDGHKLTPGEPINWLINQTATIGDSRLTLRYGTMETKRLGGE